MACEVALYARTALADEHWAAQHPFTVVNDDILPFAFLSFVVMLLVATGIGLYRPDATRAAPRRVLATMSVVTVIVAAGFLIVRVDVGSIFALVLLFVSALISTARCVPYTTQ